jgi:5'-3' exonuclease
LINELTDEIDEYLPWKVIRHPRAEADDVIGQLTRRHVAGGGDVVIISSDKDFKQLHGSNVVQWNPTMKKHVRVNPKENYLQEHIIRGDQGDFVPNILSEYEHMITEGTRQKSITKKFFEQVMNMSEDDILAHPDLSKNYKRNRELVDLSYTPTDIKMEINDMYDNYEGTTDKKKVFNYFAKKRLKLLMGDIKDV